MMPKKTCSHIDSITNVAGPKTRECEECVKIGARWVHLRTCQECGTTRCCDRLTQPARQQARQGERPPGDRLGRAGRALALLLLLTTPSPNTER